MVLGFQEEAGLGFNFKHSDIAGQGISQTKRIETASIVVAVDESGDFQSIQEAINSLDGKGGFIQIKEGRFTIPETLQIPSNITIRGTGISTVIYAKDATLTTLIENDDQAGTNTRIEISNLKIRGFYDGGNTDEGINLKNCDDCTLTDIFYQNISESFIIDNCDRFAMRNCRIIGLNSGTALIFKNSNDSIIAENHFYGENVSINLQNVERTIISSNICYNAGNVAISMDGNTHKNAIIGNQLYSSGNIGIDMYGDENIINGNAIHNAFFSGIYINAGATNNIITSNMASVTNNGTTTTVANNINT